jgi:hypothetical protein
MGLMDAGRGLPVLGAGGRSSGVFPRQLAAGPCRFQDTSRSIVFITAQVAQYLLCSSHDYPGLTYVLSRNDAAESARRGPELIRLGRDLVISTRVWLPESLSPLPETVHQVRE